MSKKCVTNVPVNNALNHFYTKEEELKIDFCKCFREEQEPGVLCHLLVFLSFCSPVPRGSLKTWTPVFPRCPPSLPAKARHRRYLAHWMCSTSVVLRTLPVAAFLPDGFGLKWQQITFQLSEWCYSIKDDPITSLFLGVGQLSYHLILCLVDIVCRFLWLYAVCVLPQVKAEEVDLQNIGSLSDNLIDFTDPTPMVSLRSHFEIKSVP